MTSEEYAYYQAEGSRVPTGAWQAVLNQKLTEMGRYDDLILYNDELDLKNRREQEKQLFL